MGNQLAPTLIPPNVGKQTALIELPGYVLNSELGGGKVLKTMECLDRNNDQVIVKVFYKREENLPLDIFHRKLKDLQKKFSLETHPGLIPFHELVESEKVCTFYEFLILFLICFQNSGRSNLVFCLLLVIYSHQNLFEGKI